MRIALAILLIPFSSHAQDTSASLTGIVVDQTGAVVVHADVELSSGTNKYKTQADETGVYKFSNLPAGEYTLKFSGNGFRNRIIIIALSEREQKRLPEVTLDIGSSGCGGPPPRDLVPLRGTLFGTLSGSVYPPAKDVEVTLVCRTFKACSSTRTDSDGHFSFETLPAGVYGLNFRRDSFYAENATGYEYTVNAGWESIYVSKLLVPCLNGNCDPKLRPIQHCE
jgi:carboxypeptidase family protein